MFGQEFGYPHVMSLRAIFTKQSEFKPEIATPQEKHLRLAMTQYL
jgi:hypothetical protein